MPTIPPSPMTDDILELEPPVAIYQIPRRVKLADGEVTRFHMFYENYGTPMALIEYDDGRVDAVMATSIVFLTTHKETDR